MNTPDLIYGVFLGGLVTALLGLWATSRQNAEYRAWRRERHALLEQLVEQSEELDTAERAIAFHLKRWDDLNRFVEPWRQRWTAEEHRR